LCGAGAAAAAETRPGLRACRLDGVEHEAWCGSLQRPLDPAAPRGTQIEIHYAVLPALARNRQADAVFVFAGGPGQSAIELAGPIGQLLARLSNRRDIVLVDQRGTGLSAPLACDDDAPTEPLALSLDDRRMIERLQACRQRLQRLPWGRLDLYPTWIAVQDVDAVRQRLGFDRIDLVGASYGTRAALEYLRQFPRAVRRVVIDGVAPPDIALPASFSTDNQAALDALLAACDGAADCRRRHPNLHADWEALLAHLPRTVEVTQPVTGVPERLTMTREMLLELVRAPLYVPALAAALPAAIEAAARGRFDALTGLASALGGQGDAKLYAGMHYSVVCAEDVPRLPLASDRPGVDFGDALARQYREICADWPRARIPAAFYAIPPSRAPVLLLSGGADPVTPPRHAARVARALGPLARSVVVAHAGHGVMSLPCMRDVVFHFIDAEDDAAALRVDAGCARDVPRPPAAIVVGAPGAP
ncbi:MAG: alpha/beta hydrolase, partial [Burkholderiales bacterium]|nr:alpha/beta hydrolase [Burkholderiales bacterium]